MDKASLEKLNEHQAQEQDTHKGKEWLKTKENDPRVIRGAKAQSTTPGVHGSEHSYNKTRRKRWEKC